MVSELVIDFFAGGGGASEGIARAIGRDPDIAVNHSPQAIATHRANHPTTRHYIEDVWRVDPREACAGRPVGLFWASPDCTHFSRAKGGAPRSKKTRALANVGWARTIVAQCAKYGTKVFVKQMGANVIDRDDAGFDAETFDPPEPTEWPTPRAVERDIDGFRTDYQGALVRIRLKDRAGTDPSEWPAGLRVQEFPAIAVVSSRQGRLL